MDLHDIEQRLISVEEFYLDGEKSPAGRQFDIDEDKEKLCFTIPHTVEVYGCLKKYEAESARLAKNMPVPKPKKMLMPKPKNRLEKLGQILDSYETTKTLGDKYFDMLSRVYYLARDIRDVRWYVEEEIGAEIIEDIRKIAQEGRTLSLSYPKTVEERINSARLFTDGENTFAAQLEDPKRGCSASICSNCDEPIAFCHTTCNCCKYELIGAHSMLNISEWRKKDIEERKHLLEKGFRNMVDEIRRNGDWRGKESPLNRYSFKDRVI